MNLSDHVEVKLTDAGQQRLNVHFAGNTITSKGVFFFIDAAKLDNGNHKFQLWKLMQIFGGENTRMSSFFENNEIILETK